MAKGQKKSNRETRKPKQDKPKPAAAPRSFLTPPTGRKLSAVSANETDSGFQLAEGFGLIAVT